MLNKDFYPTPPEVIDIMLEDVEIKGKYFLEPSAGSGNIVEVLNERGAKSVLAYEKERKLRDMLNGKCRILGDDFFEGRSEQYSHVNYIIMNPPFSNAYKHIRHAWEMAPEGCEIIALCNSANFDRGNFSTHIRQLETLVENYGDRFDLGPCFKTAERKTAVEVTMIKLFKPLRSGEFDFSGYFSEEAEERRGGEAGLMPHDQIYGLVEQYIGAVNCWDEFDALITKMSAMTSPLGLKGGLKFSISYNQSVTTRAEFAKALQKSAWRHVIAKMNLKKFVTTTVLKRIDKFVETQEKYPFTMKNIYKMVDMVIQTRGQVMDQALEDIFDRLTMHYHDNRYNVEGWKTNSHYLVNKKFILDWVTEMKHGGGMGIRYNGRGEKLDDLNKALCYVTGTDNKLQPMYMDFSRIGGTYGDAEFGKWYDWGFFQVKGFKKGTLHVKFKSDEVWALFNRRVAEIKGFPLPEKI